MDIADTFNRRVRDRKANNLLNINRDKPNQISQKFDDIFKEWLYGWGYSHFQVGHKPAVKVIEKVQSRAIYKPLIREGKEEFKVKKGQLIQIPDPRDELNDVIIKRLFSRADSEESEANKKVDNVTVLMEYNTDFSMDSLQNWFVMKSYGHLNYVKIEIQAVTDEKGLLSGDAIMLCITVGFEQLLVDKYKYAVQEILYGAKAINDALDKRLHERIVKDLDIFIKKVHREKKDGCKGFNYGKDREAYLNSWQSEAEH